MKPKTAQEIHEECIAGLNDLEEEKWDDFGNHFEPYKPKQKFNGYTECYGLNLDSFIKEYFDKKKDNI